MTLRILIATLLLSLANMSNSFAESSYPFLPPKFTIPETLETDKYRLRMLTVNDLIKDYDAVMSSVEHILVQCKEMSLYMQITQ